MLHPIHKLEQMEELNYLQNAELMISNLLSASEVKLDKESVNNIKHYLNHSEYEMAFEILFLELMKLNEKPKFNVESYKELAVKLKLNEESVFEPDFWNRFEKFLAEQS